MDCIHLCQKREQWLAQQSNEPPSFVKCWGILKWLSIWRFLKNSAESSQMLVRGIMRLMR
jgi:hypothetical protein